MTPYKAWICHFHIPHNPLRFWGTTFLLTKWNETVILYQKFILDFCCFIRLKTARKEFQVEQWADQRKEREEATIRYKRRMEEKAKLKEKEEQEKKAKEEKIESK